MDGRDPTTAVVAQKPMQRPVPFAAVNPHIRGVLPQGERGTATATAVRRVVETLPTVAVEGVSEADGDDQQALRERIVAARKRLDTVTTPDDVAWSTADLTGRLDVDSRRGDITLYRVARPLARTARSVGGVDPVGPESRPDDPRPPPEGSPRRGRRRRPSEVSAGTTGTCPGGLMARNDLRG
jgi:Mg-chelatase subunit ChlI